MSSLDSENLSPLVHGKPPLTHKKSVSGHYGLQMEEGLIFDKGRSTITGVDWENPSLPCLKALGGLEKQAPLNLPGLTEPETVRHYVRLSQKNYAIDTGIYPLGSCTMKHNPRLNEKLARLSGFSDLHPLQPDCTVQGAFALMQELGRWLLTLTGLKAVALAPRAGAHGEMCGLMAMRAALEVRGERTQRKKILVPVSAHGTNPSTAALAGFDVVQIAARGDGRLHLEDVVPHVTPQVAALMVTNPNTCGLFETDIEKIAACLHAQGAYLYCDGANFNAIMGKVRPGDLGIDAMHINLHKTFSTPHGGGGPGAGPVVVSDRLAAFLPPPFVVHEGEGHFSLHLINEDHPSIGRLTAFHGQMALWVRALAYALSHGSDGLRQVAEDAVLAANYIRVCMADLFSQPFGSQTCMHEVLFDDQWLEGTGLETLDFAKALIDEGFHPMTIYFPLVVRGAMLIEPTESESKASLDAFIMVMRDLALAIKRGEKERFKNAPQWTPRGRVDETRAARQPILRWTSPRL